MEPVAVQPMAPAPFAGATEPALVGILPDPPNAPGIVQIGIDVGQVHDPTAIAVAQVVQRRTGRVEAVSARERDLYGYLEWTGSGYVRPITETVYLMRHFARLELGLRYPEIAQRLAALVCSPAIRQRPRRVLIDQTGVGRPVVELVTDAILALPEYERGVLDIRPVTFTSGMDYDPKTGRMGKAYMVSRLQALSQADPARIVFAAGHVEAEAMQRELKDYSIKVSRDGADSYGALKTGQYDDLATAAGLAVLEDPNEYEAGYITVQGPGWPF